MKITGARPQSLEAYKVMTEKLLPKIKDGKGLEKWSFVQELYKSKNLEEYRAKQGNIDEFVSLGHRSPRLEIAGVPRI